MEIHELNTFSGTPGANDYLATDNGSDTSKISIGAITDPLNARIDNIIAGGTAPSAAEVTDARLGATVLGGVQYNSLGAAIRGQAEVLYNDISDLMEELEDNNSYNNYISSGSNITWNGITYTWNGDTCSVSGTATADSFIAIYNNSGAMPDGIKAGDVITYHIDSTDENIAIRPFFYQNGSWSDQGLYYRTRQSVVPNNAVGMLIRIHVDSGKTVNGNIKLRITNVQTNKQTGAAVPYVVPDSGNSINDVVVALLNKYGFAIFGKGTYLTTGFTMPDNTTIRGAGRASVLKTMATGQNAIVCGAGCTIESIEIDGGLTAYPSNEGTASGISIIGNRDSTPFKYNIKISNVTIHGFAKAGIYGYNTGTWVANSISVTNCEIYFCWAGILFGAYCEFNRVTNVLSRNNYCGVVNDGGNNIFVNCSLSNNQTAFYIREEQATNNGGHGALIGCTLNHSNNNTGYAMILRNIINGFVFDACHIWYGKIIASDCAGLSLNNCVFGGGTPDVEHWDNGLLLLNGCTFKQTPSFHGGHTGENVDNFIIKNCYMFDGTEITV